jgi:hypothetical protein
MNDAAVRATDDWFHRQGFSTFIETYRPDHAPLRPAVTALITANAALLTIATLVLASPTQAYLRWSGQDMPLFPVVIYLDLAAVVVTAVGFAAPAHALLAWHSQAGRLRTWRAGMWIVGCLLVPAVVLTLLAPAAGAETLGNLAMSSDELAEGWGEWECQDPYPRVDDCVETGFVYRPDSEHVPYFIALASVRAAAGLLAVLAVVWLGARFGVARLTWQSLQATFDHRRKLTTVQAQVVPVAFIAVLFIFFSAETWQMTNQLTWTRLLIAVFFFWCVALLPTAVLLRRRSIRLRERHLDAGPLSGTPAEAFVDDEGVGPPDHARTTTQKANLWIAAGLRQSGLMIAIGLTVFVCLEILGFVLVDRATAQQWIGPDVTVQGLATSEPPAFIDRNRQEAGIAWLADLWDGIAQSPAAMTRTAVLLGAFAAASVTVTLLSGAEQRDDYLGPTLEHIDRLLTVRIFYCNRLLLHHRCLVARQSGSREAPATEAGR